MLKTLLLKIVEMIAMCHDHLLQLNNSFEANLDDKQLHFLVIGILGMGLYLVVNPIFTALARRGWQAAISWMYTFTVIVVVTFAIEIGQFVTGTGNMEFADIASGIAGFLILFLIYAVIAIVVHLLRKLFEKH